MKTLIYDEKQVRQFYRTVICGTPHDDFDVDFFCVAARKKYMTQEDREATRLGDTCMMEKTPLHEVSEDTFIHKLQKVDSCLDHLYSHNGANIPRSCMVLYMNVNHTSMIDAVKDLKSEVNLIEGELYDVFMKNGLRHGVANKLKRLDTVTLKVYQNPKNVSSKNWIDIDIDLDTEKVSISELRTKIYDMLTYFPYPGVIQYLPFVIIQTHGGYHVLVSTRFIRERNKLYASDHKMNKGMVLSVDTYMTAIKTLLESKHVDAKEVKINQNAMVPIPGTLQGGKEVRIF